MSTFKKLYMYNISATVCINVKIALLSRRSRFSFALVKLTGSFVAKRIAWVESISRGGAHATCNNNSITDRLFQSKEAGGISLHSRRWNARRESSSAVCIWGRFIHCYPSDMEIRQRIPSPFLQCTNPWELLNLSLFLSPASPSLFILRAALSFSHCADCTRLLLALRPLCEKIRETNRDSSLTNAIY